MVDSFSIVGSRNNVANLDRAQSSSVIRDLRDAGDIDGKASNNKDRQKIEKSARAFESMLVAQWLEQAEKSFATVPGEDPDKKNQDVGQDQFRSIAFHSLADGLTNGRGFGIASMIIGHLEAAADHQDVERSLGSSAKPKNLR